MSTFVQGAYILAGLLFILALAGLSKHETARRGNRFGMAGMAIALLATVLAAVTGEGGSGWVGRANTPSSVYMAASAA